ncbi:MAG: hypothetical protein J6A94_02000 [Lachnospiraceae bacterium]|nr:hypothetical protein [Lachnospiraceae bacterium]
MKDTYLVSRWALVRQGELVDIPPKLEIHPDFLKKLSQEEFETAFRDIGNLFYQIYSDIADAPEEFGFPLYKIEEYSYFSKEAREARTASWNIFYLLLILFACGEWKEKVFVVETAAVREKIKVKKINLLLKALCSYGFVFEGISKFSLSSGSKMEIDYPDNHNVLEVLSLVAKKVMDTQLKGISNYFSCMVAFSNGFISWNYKVLIEELNTCTLAKGCDYVADKMHTEEEKEVVDAIHKVMMENGLSVQKGDLNEGPALRYYRSKSTYDFALMSDRGKLVLELRIRNVRKCLEYLKECSDSIVDMFRHTDQGYRNRVNGTCKYGVKYEFEGEEKWHCGCCGAPFKIYPVKADIPHYLKLVELGSKR